MKNTKKNIKQTLKFFFIGIMVFTLLSACAEAGAGSGTSDNPVIKYNVIAQGLGDYNEASSLPTTKVEALTTLGIVGFVTVQTFIAAISPTSTYGNWTGLYNAIIAGNTNYTTDTISYELGLNISNLTLNTTADIDDVFNYADFDFGPDTPTITGEMDVFLDADIIGETTATELVDVLSTTENYGDDVLLPTEGTIDVLLTANIGYTNVDAGDNFEIVDGFFHFNTDLATDTSLTYNHTLPPKTISVDYDGTVTITFAVSVTSGTLIPNGGKYVLIVEFESADTIDIDLTTDLDTLLASLSSSLLMTLDVCKNDGEIVNSYSVSVEDFVTMFNNLLI